MSNAVVHALVIFFFSYGTFNNTITQTNGRDSGLQAMGTTINFCAVVVVNAKISFTTRYWTWVHWASMAFSIGIWFAFVQFYSVVDWEYWGTGNIVHGSAVLYLLVTLVSVAALTPDVVVALYVTFRSFLYVCGTSARSLALCLRLASGASCGQALSTLHVN